MASTGCNGEPEVVSLKTTKVLISSACHIAAIVMPVVMETDILRMHILNKVLMWNEHSDIMHTLMIMI